MKIGTSVFLVLQLLVVLTVQSADDLSDLNLEDLEIEDMDPRKIAEEELNKLFPDKTARLNRRSYLEFLTRIYTHMEIKDIRAAREREIKGAKIDKHSHEAVLFHRYLEEYMRGVKNQFVDYNFVREEIMQKRPADFIIRRLREDTYKANKAALDKQKGEIRSVVDDAFDRMDL